MFDMLTSLILYISFMDEFRTIISEDFKFIWGLVDWCLN